MRTLRSRGARALGAVALSASALVSAAASSATATDIDSLRDRAQRLGDQVSGLERELAELDSKKASLSDEIAESSARLGALELQVRDAQIAYDAAMDRYIARAVEAYKSGPSSDLALLLSARTMDELAAAAEVTARSAEMDGEALSDLVAARGDAERAQEFVDARKQMLLAQQAKVDTLSTEIETTIAARRAVFRDLNREIKTLERAALRAAARSADPEGSLLELLRPSGPAPRIPDGFAGTGVTFSGVASWYGPGFEGNPTANGDIFDPDLFTAASLDLPLGTWLYVAHEGRGVVVLVNDRGPYIDGRVLDLSQAAAEAIGISGIGWVDAEILVKTH